MANDEYTADFSFWYMEASTNRSSHFFVYQLIYFSFENNIHNSVCLRALRWSVSRWQSNDISSEVFRVQGAIQWFVIGWKYTHSHWTMKDLRHSFTFFMQVKLWPHNHVRVETYFYQKIVFNELVSILRLWFSLVFASFIMSWILPFSKKKPKESFTSKLKVSV